MALFDFLKKKKKPQNNTMQGNPVNNEQNGVNSAIWERADSIFIGNQHISDPDMHINCDVKYIPTNRMVVCRTTSTSDDTPRYETLAVPSEINTADGLIAFILSQKPWLVQGYKLSDELSKRINAMLSGNSCQQESEISGDYLEQIKRVAIKYMPSSMSAAQLKTVFDMLSGLVDIETVMIMLDATSWANAHRAEENGDSNAAAIIGQAFAETGFKINQFLGVLKESYFANKIASVDEETLLKAFIAADFYAFHLKEEFNANLRKLQVSIAREMLKRGFTVFASRELSEFEQLQARCNEAVKENPDAEATKELVLELGKNFLTLDKIYVAYDEDFNNQFPYIGTDGRIEVSTQLGIAKDLVDYYHEQHLGHISIREFEGKQIIETLNSYQNMGISVMRLDNGSKPVDIWFRDILDPISDNLLEKRNNCTKGEFLRELQYGYRIRKLDPSEKGGKLEHNLMEMMLTMRYNAYRDFGNGLCYVLTTTPYKAGTTFYTEKALAKAKEMLEEENLPESTLVAQGDSNFAVYDSTVNLRVAQKSVQTMDESLVCAFTGRREAEMVRTNFLQHGVDDSVLVITFDELYSHAMQCAGILIDMPTYGLELMKKDFQDVAHWRAVSGRILVNLKDNNG